LSWLFGDVLTLGFAGGAMPAAGGFFVFGGFF
jgi:hypothetical protein